MARIAFVSFAVTFTVAIVLDKFESVEPSE
jgi:hypothetical protein